MRMLLVLITAAVAGIGLFGCTYEEHHMGAKPQPVTTKEVIVIEDEQRAPVIEKHIIHH